MYRGYNLKLEWDTTEVEKFYAVGLSLFDFDREIVQKTLDGFTLKNGKLDGTKIKDNWFPEMKDYHVFISHSHSDAKKAIAFAGWLFEKYKIRAFVDSCLWGYADDLLWLIDKDYCFDKKRQTFDYSLRNYSTSHVHMMLSTALTMMLDTTECLFFLNTPNSISVSDVVSKTESPWIYSEIAISKVLRRKPPVRRETVRFSKGGVLNEDLKIEYKADLSHFTDIDIDLINKVVNTGVKGTGFLTQLYKLTSVGRDIING